MSRFDYQDPGTDSAYCDGLAPDDVELPEDFGTPDTDADALALRVVVMSLAVAIAEHEQLALGDSCLLVNLVDIINTTLAERRAEIRRR